MTEASAAPTIGLEAAPAPPPLRRNHDFIRLWVGAGISRFGSYVGMTAYPMLVLWGTGSVTGAGYVAMAAALPSLLLQLPAGALVDRWDRRRVMLCCDVIGTVGFAAVAVAVLLHWIWIPAIMAAAFLESLLGNFYVSSEQAAIRSIVPREQLQTAFSQNQVRSQTIGLLGQPLSGFMFSALRALPFLFTAVANTVAVTCVVFVRRDLRAARADRSGGLHTDIWEGIVWLWRQKFLRIMVGMFAGSNFAFRILSLTIMVAIMRHGGSPTVLGLAGAISGIGGVLGAVAASWWSRRFSLYTTAVGGHLLWAVLMPLLAFQSNPIAIIVISFAIMTVASLFNVTAGVYQARTTPAELQGRVLGTANFVTSVANVVGSLVAGYLLAAAGPAGSGLVVGATLLLLTVVVATNPTVRAETRRGVAAAARGAAQDAAAEPGKV